MSTAFLYYNRLQPLIHFFERATIVFSPYRVQRLIEREPKYFTKYNNNCHQSTAPFIQLEQEYSSNIIYNIVSDNFFCE